MRKLISVFLSLAIFLSLFGISVSATEQITVEIVDFVNYIDIEDDNSVVVKLSNRTGADAVVDLRAEVKNTGSTVVCEETATVSLKNNSVTHCPLPLKLAERGEYSMKVSATQNGTKLTEYTRYIYADNEVVPHDNVGVCNHFNRSLNSKLSDVTSIKKTGFTMIRDEIRWDDVELKKGEYKIPINIINFIDKANEAGMEVLVELAYNNPLYSGEKATGIIPVTTENINAYGEYVRFVVRELKGKVKYFEVWNEPNHESFNKNNATAAQYVELLKKAYGIITYENPDAIVVSGSVAGAAGAKDYIKEMVAAGALDYMDVFGVHPYCCWTGAIVDERDTLDYSSEIDILINECGINKDIWITEVGYTTHYPKDADEYYYTEEEKGAYNVRTIVEFKADQRVKKLLLYLFKAEEEDDYFHLVNADNTAGEGYKIVRTMNYLLSNADFVKKWSISYYSVYQFRDKTTGDDIFVLWTKKGVALNLAVSGAKTEPAAELAILQQALKLDIGTVNADSTLYHYDAYGNKTEAVLGDSFRLDFKPTYLVCERNDSCNITLENGRIKGEGYIKDNAGYITIKAMDRKEQTIAYINQVSVDENGRFSFSFPIQDGEVYDVYIYNGMMTSEKVNNGGVDVEFSIVAGDNEVEKISQVQKGDTVTASVSVENKGDSLGKLKFVAAVYTKDKDLFFVDVKDIVADKDTENQAMIEILTTDIDKWESMKLFLWQSDTIKNIVKNIELKR